MTQSPLILLVLAMSATVTFISAFSTAPPQFQSSQQSSLQRQRYATVALHESALDSLVDSFNSALETNKKEVSKTCNVKVGLSDNNNRLGLIATENIKKGDRILTMPHDERWELTATTAKNVVFQGVLDKEYEGWTGDNGLIALQLLNEMARTAGAGGIEKPSRPSAIQEFMAAWVQALPSPSEMNHPLLWSENDQEVLQSSSNTKIYRVLDDIEEDATWLVENVFSKDRTKFPETVQLNGADVPCFSLEGYRWAMALVQSRSVFVDASVRFPTEQEISLQFG